MGPLNISRGWVFPVYHDFNKIVRHVEGTDLVRRGWGMDLSRRGWGVRTVFVGGGYRPDPCTVARISKILVREGFQVCDGGVRTCPVGGGVQVCPVGGGVRTCPVGGLGTDLSRKGFGHILCGEQTCPVGAGGYRPDPSTVPSKEPGVSP